MIIMDINMIMLTIFNMVVNSQLLVLLSYMCWIKYNELFLLLLILKLVLIIVILLLCLLL